MDIFSIGMSKRRPEKEKRLESGRNLRGFTREERGWE
jgi:hypothetical protein